MKPIMSLRVAKTASDTKSYSLGVPVEIARLLEAADKTTFTFELTADGVLYRPVETTRETLSVPDWLTAQPAESSTTDEESPAESAESSTTGAHRGRKPRQSADEPAA